MLHLRPLVELMFSDIETTSQYPSFKEMPEELQEIFRRRYKKQFSEIEKMPYVEQEPLIEELYSTTAPLQPEWGRILCISMGWLEGPHPETGEYKMTVKSYADKDEKRLLQRFIAATENISKGPIYKFSWVFHNGTSFDIPFIAKRIILNGLPLPNLWDFGHLKPWELDRFIDSKTVWKMSVYDNSVSLDHLAYLFGLPSSKDEMDGAGVKDEFWIKDNLEGITKYCAKDVVVLAKIYLKMKNVQANITVV